jgi:hypothetical protein
VGSNGASNPICLADTVTNAGWVNWDGGMVWRANGSASNEGQYANGANDFVCAVCLGTVYVHWGQTTCAAGWTKLFDGWVASIGGYWGAASPGGPVCLPSNVGANWTNWGSIRVIRHIGSSGSNRVQYQNSEDMVCAVCY